MTDGPVILGGVVFQDFEIPAKINLGGKQRLKKHEIVGNTRVVDAMGPEPADKKWTGRFRGADAIARAQAVDAMRISGQQVSLTWLGLYYTVVVEDFQADTEKRFEVPYSITVCVVDDPAQDGGGASGSLDSLAGGDLSSLGNFGASFGGGSSSAFSGLASAFNAVPSLASASPSQIAPVKTAALALVSSLGDDVLGTQAALDTASPDGADPAVIAAWLTATASTAATASNAADALGYAGRLATNLLLAGLQ